MAIITIEIDDSLVQSFNRFIARNYSTPMTLKQFVLYQIEQLTNEVVDKFPPDTVADELLQIEALKSQMKEKLRPKIVPDGPVSPEPMTPTARKRI